MFMSNIPRRRIYEVMLEYEDGIIEMQILIYSEENFEKYKEKFVQTYERIKEAYLEILGLFVMFLENRKYPIGDDMMNDLKVMLKNMTEVKNRIYKNKNLPII